MIGRLRAFGCHSTFRIPGAATRWELRCFWPSLVATMVVEIRPALVAVLVTVASPGTLIAQPPQGKPPRPPASAAAKNAATTTVVAVVNQEQILRSELARECLRRFGEDVLESEVNKRLILEACREAGIQVTTEEVAAEVERMAQKFGVSVDRWLAMLQEERGISATQYRRDVVWPMLCLRKLAANALEVTEQELDEAYESEYGEMVQVRMIAAKSKARAEQLHAAAMKQPKSFDRLAKDYSEDEASATQRGLIPPVRRYVGDPTIEEVVFALQEGDTSPVVEVAGMHYFFRCERRIPPRELSPEQQTQVRGQLAEAIGEKKLREVGNDVFRDLQEQAKVVNVYNDAQRSKEMPGVAALVNEQPITLADLGSQCILRHGADVLHGEINRKILTQALRRRSLEVVQADLQAEIGRAAEAYGYVTKDGNADVKAWLKHVVDETQVTVDTYIRDVVWPSAALKKLVASTVDVSDEDLQKGFEANYGPRVEVLAIVLSNQRTAQEVFELARDNPTDKFFGELANQYSIEPVSRANFGQVPPIRQWGGQPFIEQEAFRLKPGEISGVLASGDKFVLLRCLGRTQPVVQKMADVRDELERDIREKKLRLAMDAEFDRLRKTAQIDNFLDRSVQPSANDIQRVGYEAKRGRRS